MGIPDWSTIADQAQAYAPHIAAGAGAVGMLLAAYAIRRFTKTREHDDLAANLGVVLFGVVTTEGMWEVVHHKLGVNIGLTIAMFAAFDVVIYSQGRMAIRKLTANPKARVGTYLAIIWALSIAAALTVSTAGGNLTTQLFRFFSPMVAAALWTQKVLELRSGTTERADSNWIWTPDRLLVRWGLKKPGAVDDLSQVFATRRIAALVDAGLELHAQQQAGAARTESAEPGKRSWRRREDPLVVARRRVQRLTKAATPEDMAAARKQLRLILNAETELFRDDSQPSERERALMDELRLVMRQATTNLRADGIRAFKADQSGEPMWSNGMVQMRSSVADQIRTSRVDQPLDRPVVQSRTSEVDQSRTIPAPVDQPVISGSVPAERTSPEARTTVRVDRAKPVSPAAGGEIAPRIRDMVRELKKAYRGDIPGRRTVMDRMGWTSAGDAQTAINLVRAERSKK
ncbi:hypothetical protein O7598_31125 [Micromonospora sp. WMMC241]|uniref:hypothetical protein n=1 Tax=Micromonospora sp. WMMC241 TaxID=3015159 RepID=UPI0022B6C129|nr:hypothetical protein [Micromonospora sp. WMMC241]MCZ7440795.1 hypothetical protein [Micromonospora sp. WMMC241]MCZ7440878.1 hypothetical protein [Micromonospora sp. WMMC241]